MATIEETINICGYYDDSWMRDRQDGKFLLETKSLRDIMDELDEPFRRWPVRNREPRTEISSIKRAIIHERDGGICRLCGTGGHLLTVDHIIPRSTFTRENLRIADRSDNLISACWECNSRKSNYEHPQVKRMGVTMRCWDCLHPEYDPENYRDDTEWEDPRPITPVLAYCGGCGITNVPAVQGWIL